MAKNNAAAATKSAGTKTINRKRRSSLERKCLSKSAKRMFSGSTSDIFKMILEAEKIARKKDRKMPIMGMAGSGDE